MFIKKIINQTRRDFTAVYECEYCSATVESYGYDDSHFHQNVIPNMKCKECEKTASENYRPLATKYNENQII